MSDLSPEELELLSTFREEWGPTKETKDAVRAAIPEALRTTPELPPDGDAPPGPSPDPSNAPPGSGGGLSRGAWAGAGLAAIGLCVVGLVWLRNDVPASSAPASVRDVPAANAAPSAPLAPSTAALTPLAQTAPQTEAVSLDSLPNAPPQNPSASHGAAQPAPAASADTLAEELALLRTAQNALRDGAPDDALAALSKHATRFPRGVLREERMTLQVLALCDRGDVTAARAARADLEKVAPGSSHLQRLSSSCAAR